MSKGPGLQLLQHCKSVGGSEGPIVRSARAARTVCSGQSTQTSCGDSLRPHIETLSLSCQQPHRFGQEKRLTGSLSEEAPWPQVLKRVGVLQKAQERCTCGVQNIGRSERDPCMRRTYTVAASCWAAVWPLQQHMLCVHQGRILRMGLQAGA